MLALVIVIILPLEQHAGLGSVPSQALLIIFNPRDIMHRSPPTGFEEKTKRRSCFCFLIEKEKLEAAMNRGKSHHIYVIRSNQDRDWCACPFDRGNKTFLSYDSSFFFCVMSFYSSRRFIERERETPGSLWLRESQMTLQQFIALCIT